METKQSSALDKVVTVHNTADREIIQHFGDESVKIVTDIETKKTGLFVNGALKLVTINLTIEEYLASLEASFMLWSSLLIKQTI